MIAFNITTSSPHFIILQEKRGRVGVLLGSQAAENTRAFLKPLPFSSK